MIAQVDFENLLKDAIGLDPASVGSATIESAVRLRMAALGIGQSDQYWDKLGQSDEELQELIETVVVPETWFFRDQEAFAALARLVTQHWLPSHPNDVLRLLSGPCCTGEEPYSMVMALLDAGVTREQLQVDAVDISARFLNRARRGIYGLHSFRGEDLSFRDRYFEKIDKGYCLPEWLRTMVSFKRANLLSPKFEMGALTYDVIFCRNLLIYFDQSTQRRVLKTLAALLSPSGFLFVGPAEAFLAASTGFTSVNQSMSFAFRRSDGSPSPLIPIPQPPKKLAKAARSARQEPIVKKTAPPVLLSQKSAAIEAEHDHLDRARSLADAGRLAEAGELCETLLKQQGVPFEAFYLLGVVRDSMGDLESAAQCYRKALYLKPNHYETLVHLALLSERRGDGATAKKLNERARRSAKERGQE